MKYITDLNVKLLEGRVGEAQDGLGPVTATPEVQFLKKRVMLHFLLQERHCGGNERTAHMGGSICKMRTLELMKTLLKFKLRKQSNRKIDKGTEQTPKTQTADKSLKKKMPNLVPFGKCKLKQDSLHL